MLNEVLRSMAALVARRLYSSLVAWPGDMWRSRASVRKSVTTLCASTLFYAQERVRVDNPRPYEDVLTDVEDVLARWWPENEENPLLLLENSPAE